MILALTKEKTEMEVLEAGSPSAGLTQSLNNSFVEKNF